MVGIDRNEVKCLRCSGGNGVGDARDLNVRRRLHRPGSIRRLLSWFVARYGDIDRLVYMNKVIQR